jgi:hypothetical protein
VSPELRLQLHDAHPYAPGETIRGNVLVAEGGGSRSLRVELRYSEKTKDYSSVSATVTTGPLHEGDLTDATSFEFELAVPEDALPSYSGIHGGLYWELDVVSDELGPDTHDSRLVEVVVKPRV